MSAGLKWSIYGLTLLLLVTGLGYAVPFYLDEWFFVDLPLPIPVSTLMAGHGLGAAAMGVALGMLWQSHARARLAAAKRRMSGVGLMTFMGLLMVTGYLLYYGSGDTLRDAASNLHTLLGIAMPLLLVAHRVARQSRALMSGRKAGGDDPGGPSADSQECYRSA